MSTVPREQSCILAPEGPIAAEIKQLGFSSPIPLLSPAERDALEQHLGRPDLPAPLDWRKGQAATDRTIYEVAARPRLIALLRPLLGEDIVLWGAITIRRRPGTTHPWHTDMESSASGDRVISVWIGVRNVRESSGLSLVAGSHQFGCSVQEALAKLQEDRTIITEVRMAEIARGMNSAARIVQPDVQDGQAVLFDGRVWHSGRNDSAQETRTALLLQYASADTAIQMPAGAGYEWPLKFAASPRVPAILVSGTGRHSANRLVPPPPPRDLKGMPMITTVARSIALPLAEDPVKRWRAYDQFRGPTRTLGTMSCHISVLSPGHHPHPPHIHQEEELLIVLDGEAEIELADDAAGTGSRRHSLRPGMFSYYPATQHHTIHNVSASPATYLMFKWHAGIADMGEPLQASVFEYDTAAVPENPKPIFQKPLFQQATHCLGKLHAHLSILQPGAGYEPHVDAYDVAIIVLAGEVETVGERVNPLGLVYYSAGEWHGMRNVGSTPAAYLVFEFHSPAAVALKQQQRAEQHGGRAAQQAEQRALHAERRAQQSERRAQQAEQRAQRAERRCRKLEKQASKRGVGGLFRRIVKAVRRLGR